MKKILIFISVIVILFSCKKEQQSFCVDAAVTWGGDPAADGLGWYLLVDSTRGISYIPQNLPDNFKIDGLLVNTCLYKTNEKFYCQCAQPLNKYHITSIKKL